MLQDNKVEAGLLARKLTDVVAKGVHEMPSVFHYTDARGLLGICSTNTLFATHYRYLNDISEGGIIRQLILPIFEDEIAKITPKLVEKKWLRQGFYDEYGVGGHALQAEALYRAMVRTIDNVSPFFVLSFCRHEERSQTYSHGLLSQ
jgi:hypothetical protein